MVDIQKKLESRKIKTYIPVGFGGDDKKLKENLTYEEDSERKVKYNLIKDHYKKILNSDAILVENLKKNDTENYIGGNVFLEMGFAYVNNRPVFLYNPIPESTGYKSEIMAMEPEVILGDLDKILEHFESLPKVYVASTSRLKLDAVSAGLKKVNFQSRVLGRRIKSGVPSQPIGFDQMLLGAENRLNRLKTLEKDFELLISIESGLAKVGKYVVDLAVCLVEDEKGKRQMSLSNGSNVPRHLAEQVFEKGKELGVYLQQEFGMQEKDVVNFLTRNKRERIDHLAEAIATAYAQLNF
jgi:inosine/xanthosine triphosphatase